jgi:hypothetical protein
MQGFDDPEILDPNAQRYNPCNISKTVAQISYEKTTLYFRFTTTSSNRVCQKSKSVVVAIAVSPDSF